MNTNNKTYGIVLKGGGSYKLEGVSIQDCFEQMGKKTPDGENTDFSLLDFFYLVPIPIMADNIDEYQVWVKRSKTSDWEVLNRISNSFGEMEQLMELKVKLEGYFTGIVMNLTTEKVMSWKWTH